MKIRAKQVQILVIALAATLIVFGSLNALFHVVPDSALAGKISDGLFIAGIVAYFWSWKLRKQEAAEDAADAADAKADSERITDGDGADGTAD